MFGIGKKKAAAIAVLSSVATAVSSKRNDYETVAEIHNMFETASDRALAEAKAIIAGNKVANNDEELSNILSDAGFGQAKLVSKVKNLKTACEMSEERARIVEEFAIKYPQYKFIFEDQVLEICKKYNLVFGDVTMYKGDVPEKNIREIAKFNVKDEDVFYETMSHISTRFNKTISKVELERELKSAEEHSANCIKYGIVQNHDSSFEYRHAKKIPFNICAPVSDMNIPSDHELNGVKISKKEIPDPIVLHRVHKKGFLIVSKWGLEGQDPALVNENAN